MLCYQISHVWINYEESFSFRGLNTAYILFNLPNVQEVISAQTTALALRKDIYSHKVKTTSLCVCDTLRALIFCVSILIFTYGAESHDFSAHICWMSFK